MVRWYFLTDSFEGFDWVGFIVFLGIILGSLLLLYILFLLIGFIGLMRESFFIFFPTDSYRRGDVLLSPGGQMTIIGKKKIGHNMWRYRVVPRAKYE